MSIPSFDVGDGLTLSAVFTKKVGASEVAADPTIITFDLLAPDGQVNHLSISRNDVGSYFVDFVAAAAPGVWEYKILGAGAVQAALAGKFIIRSSRF